MTNSLFRGRTIFWAALLGIVFHSHALTVTNGPFLLQTNKAPLACKLLLSTDVDSRVSVQIVAGSESWRKDFYDYSTTHSLILPGFKPNRTNVVTVTLHDRYRNLLTLPTPLTFQTTPLPSDFPPITLRTNQPARMEPGYTLFRAQNNGSKAYMIIVNNQGQVVWYSDTSSNVDVRQRPNGNLFFFNALTFFEMNLFGEVVATWSRAPGFNIDQHDGVPTDHGTILYLSAGTLSVTNFPGSATVSNAPPKTVSMTHQPVIEMSMTNSSSFTVWRTIDMIDPRHITYFYNGGTAGVDFEHSNALIEDPRDNSIIVSMRHQNAVIKFSRATGQLKWILGPHPNYAPQYQQYLLTPTGTPFAWNYGQHAPKITPQGTLLVYDDGNFRASPYDAQVTDPNNYSRAVEYVIDEENMEVSQVWEYGSDTPERLYTPSVGDVDWLPKTGNVLVSFANISYVNGVHPSSFSPNATMVRFKEVTHDDPADVVFDLELFDRNNTSATYAGCFSYRSARIPDLYSVQPGPIEDLTARYEDGKVQLRFSADPSLHHRVEASTDLSGWEEIGTPTAETGLGDFIYEDAEASEFPARFYRVVSSLP
jgi:arylsulfate sulfotransferase